MMKQSFVRSSVTSVAQLVVVGWVALSLASCSSCSSCDEEEVPDRPALPDQKVSLFSDAYQFVCSPDRAVGCDGVFPLRHAAGDFPSEVAVLETGEDALRARIMLLEEATRSIRIQALIFRGDEAGLRISEVLKRKAKDGVDVRVIVDALSNLDQKTQWMYFDLKQHGVEVEGYETLYFNWIAADWKASDPLRQNKRFHDKLWIVDAEDLKAAKAIVGGLNIANEYFRVANDPLMRWRDQDVLLRGAVVKDATRGFDRNYDYLKGLKERLPAVFNPDNSWKLTRTVLGAIDRIDIPKWKDESLDGQIDKILNEPLKPVYRPLTARFMQSRPRFKESYISQAYLHVIKRAKQRIDLVNAYFVPSRELIVALQDAARRGVHVRILTNSPITNDIGPIATLSRHLYLELIDVNLEPGTSAHAAAGKGLEIREWIGPEKDEGTLHAKFILVDEETALVGSYNLDPRSEKLNSETAIAIRSKETVAQMRKQLEEEDFAKSRAVTREEAQSYQNPDGIKAQFDLLFSLPMKGWL